MHLNMNSDLLFHCQVSNQQGKLEEKEKKDKVGTSIFTHASFSEFPSCSLPKLEVEHRWSVRNKDLQITDMQSFLYMGWCQ